MSQKLQGLQKSLKDIKKSWVGVKSLMSLKQKNNNTSLIRNDEKYIDDPITIANTFYHFFTSTADTIQSKIQFSNKSFRSFYHQKTMTLS